MDVHEAIKAYCVNAQLGIWEAFISPVMSFLWAVASCLASILFRAFPTCIYKPIWARWDSSWREGPAAETPGSTFFQTSCCLSGLRGRFSKAHTEIRFPVPIGIDQSWVPYSFWKSSYLVYDIKPCCFVLGTFAALLSFPRPRPS